MIHVETLVERTLAGGFFVCARSEDGVHDWRQRRIGDERCPGGVVVFDVDDEPGEDGAVQDAAGFVIGDLVEAPCVGEQLDDLVEPGEQVVAGGLGVLDEALCVCDLHGGAGLAGLQHVDGQRIGHVGVEEFLLVALQLCQAPALVNDEAAAGFG
ncbi:MAG: hypothetical protein NTX33_00130 [Propionibacteriales bacterium]|nr:hypothetical protein [Propionibacteriales bacterium]